MILQQLCIRVYHCFWTYYGEKKTSKLLPSGWVFPFAAADSDFRAGVARRCALSCSFWCSPFSRAVSWYMWTMQVHRAPAPLGGTLKLQVRPQYLRSDPHFCTFAFFFFTVKSCEKNQVLYFVATSAEVPSEPWWYARWLVKENHHPARASPPTSLQHRITMTTSDDTKWVEARQVELSRASTGHLR